MKKILITLFVFLFFTTIYTSVFAAPLTTITTDTSLSTVKPGEEITVNVNFGQDLGAYTVDIAYDNNLFDYISSTGGTSNDNGDRVRLFFFDNTGGTAPSNSMSVTFRAKSNLINTNPTNFSITANGMANADASVTFDDITTPIEKNITIRPDYVPYTFDLLYTAPIETNVAENMQLNLNSSLGESFSNTRIIAEAITPTGATVNLMATDATTSTDFDLLTDGWGSTAGDSIGGLNVSKQLTMMGTFSEAGNYTLTFKLIDKNNSNTILAENSFNLNVSDVSTTPTTPPTTTTPETTTPEDTTEQTMPENLPKTGTSIYEYIIPILLILIVFTAGLSKIYFSKKQNRKI